MRKNSLSIIHIKKRGASERVLRLAAALREELDDCFCLESCQRWIWVLPASESDRLPVAGEGLELMHGREAYDFLLRVATGLESAVVGESDIFGQIKEAWKGFSGKGSPLLRELGVWMQRLFEDTKEIRSLHMQDLGGASYGSLVRRMLHGRRVRPEGEREKVLLVGAGKLALSIAPWLAGYDLLLWNRSPGKLQALEDEINSKKTASGGTMTRVVGPEAESAAWRDADHVVVCVPADKAEDGRRMADRLAGAAGRAKGLVLHLGGFKPECQDWAAAIGDGFVALDDLFQLKEAQDSARGKAIRAARHACRERARLRGLGGLSVPHGWEDLMGFACDRELSLSWVS